MVSREKKSADQTQNPCNAGKKECDSDGQTEHGCITFLSERNELDMITEDALAEAFGVTKRTIRRMIARFEIPEPLILGGIKIWKVGTIAEHVNNMSRLTLQKAEMQVKKSQT